MLLVYKRHAYLMVNGFRAYISEGYMAYWCKHAQSCGLMVRRMSA